MAEAFDEENSEVIVRTVATSQQSNKELKVQIDMKTPESKRK